MPNDKKIIGGIIALFIGFYVLLQTTGIEKLFGLLIMAVGLYFILSSIQ